MKKILPYLTWGISIPKISLYPCLLKSFHRDSLTRISCAQRLFPTNWYIWKEYLNEILLKVQEDTYNQRIDTMPDVPQKAYRKSQSRFTCKYHYCQRLWTWKDKVRTHRFRNTVFRERGKIWYRLADTQFRPTWKLFIFRAFEPIWRSCWYTHRYRCIEWKYAWWAWQTGQRIYWKITHTGKKWWTARRKSPSDTHTFIYRISGTPCRIRIFNRLSPLFHNTTISIKKLQRLIPHV